MNPNRLNLKAMLLVGLFVLLAIVLFAFIVMNQNQEPELEIVTSEDTSENTEEETGLTERITAKHAYADGVHTVVGTYPVPTACHRLLVEPFFIEGNADRVELRFDIEGPEDEDVLCAQVVTNAPFKVEFEAPESATLSAKLNDQSIILNLAPAEPGENLDEFEEFYKG